MIRQKHLWNARLMSAADELENNKLGRWGPIAQVGLLLVLAGPLLAAVLSGPSLWNLAFAAAWVSAAVAVGRKILFDYRRVRRIASTAVVRPVPSWEVPKDDVYAAVSSTRSRADAIEALRQRHPGLGLVDAANLINTVLGGPNR
jgi:hypothetical protein